MMFKYHKPVPMKTKKLNQYIVWTSVILFLFIISLVISPLPDTDYVRGFMAWEDATFYFNRANNLNGGFAFFQYAGYVSFTPEVLTYLFSFLPYLIQSFCYALTALLAGAWMFYQFAAILIDAGARPRLAYGVALAVAAYLHIVCQDFYLNLTFAMWPALIGASIYVVRIAFAGAKPRWFATILAAISFASHPLAIASLPIIGASLYLRRAQLTIPHAIVLVLGILLVVAFTDASRNAASLHTILEALPLYLTSMLHFDVHDFVTVNLPIIIMLAGISVGLVRLPGLIRSGSTQAAAILAGSLFLAPLYLALFLTSGRFTIGNISGRYFTPTVVFAILALTVSFVGASWLTALGRRLERFSGAPAHGFLAVWLVLSLAAGPAIFWKHYANRLQFLAAAQCMRENGHPDFAIAAEDYGQTLAIAQGLGHFDRSSTGQFIDFRPSLEPLAEFQRFCPGIKLSYVQAVRNAHIWLGIKAF